LSCRRAPGPTTKGTDRDPETAIRPKRDVPFDGAAPPTGDEEAAVLDGGYGKVAHPDAGAMAISCSSIAG